MARQFFGASALATSGKLVPLYSKQDRWIWTIDKDFSGPTTTIVISAVGTATGGNAAGLFTEMDKISTGGPGGTKLTILTVGVTGGFSPIIRGYKPPSGGNVAKRSTPYYTLMTSSPLKFTIDWENKKVSWSGILLPWSATNTFAYKAVDGSAVIPETEGDIIVNTTFTNLSRGDPGIRAEKFTVLRLDPVKRTITGLPTFPTLTHTKNRYGSAEPGYVMANYTVETDDYQTTTVAPTPDPTPDPGDGIDVSGTKISELTPATTPLKDSDLLVLSQGGEDGTYDSSNNITYAKLKEEVGGGGGGDPAKMWSSGWVNTDGNTAVANQATLSFAHNLGTTDVVFNVYWSPNADGTDNMLLSNAEIGSSGTSTLSLQIKSLTATNVTIQLSNLGMIQVNNNGTRTGEVSFDGGFIKVIAMGKTTFTPGDSEIHACGFITTAGVVSHGKNIDSVSVNCTQACTFSITLSSAAQANALVVATCRTSTTKRSTVADIEYKWTSTTSLEILASNENLDGISFVVYKA